MFDTKVTIFFLIFVAVSLPTGNGSLGSERLIRVPLSKRTEMQIGTLGQPLTSYYVNLNVGTPPNTYSFLVDINARESWLPHYLRMGVVFYRLNYKNGYSKKSSSSSEKEDQSYSFEYQKANFKGKPYRDVFEFVNMLEGPTEAKFKQRFLAIHSVSDDRFGKRGISGVLALSPWPFSSTGNELLLPEMARAGLIKELKFCLLLNSGSDKENSSGGEITFGGVDVQKHQGMLRYHKGLSNFHWEVSLQSVLIGYNYVFSGNNHTRGLVLSTSHNDIFGPPTDVEQALRLLGVLDREYDPQHLYELDCLKVVQLPSITFQIDGIHYTIPASSYIKKKVDGHLFKSETCYVSLLSSGDPNRWEVGTNFLSRYYTVFDLQNGQVAFGNLKD